MLTCIDLFAGGGGFSEGAAQAGLQVLWAANHNQEAIEYHWANHPDTMHVCQDLHQADWSLVPPHDILLASPACTGHANARGTDLPKHDKDRSTAWAVVSAVEHHRPAAFVVENVREFTNWVLYEVWVDALRRLGYALHVHVLDAADFGTAQNRVRVFIVGVKGRTPLKLTFEKKPHVPARDVVDFGPGKWSTIDRPGRSRKTLARIERGRKQHGARFLMSYYGTSSGGRSLDRPVGTLTTKARWALVDGGRMRMLTPAEAREVAGFPPTYILPENVALAHHLLGNAVSPAVAKALLRRLQSAL